jgi:hypothetical protein
MGQHPGRKRGEVRQSKPAAHRIPCRPIAMYERLIDHRHVRSAFRFFFRPYRSLQNRNPQRLKELAAHRIGGDVQHGRRLIE